MKINLILDDSLDAHIKSRANYVFNIFCSVYSINKDINGIKVFYGKEQNFLENTINLSCDHNVIGRNVYCEVLKPKSLSLNSQYLFSEYGIDEIPIFSSHLDSIDFISESFEFLSLAHEYAVTDRDSIGRIDFELSLFVYLYLRHLQLML